MSKLFTLALLLLACPSAAQSPPRQWLDKLSGIEFVEIPAGCFDMGEPEAGPTDDGMPIQVPRADEIPRHRVCVGAFSLGKYEVTRAQWQAVMGEQASSPADPDPRQPATLLGWNAAQVFIQRLNALPQGKGYRLPTESEWEYACRAGVAEPARQLHGEVRYSHVVAMVQFARFSHPSVRSPRPSPVGTKMANAWGLHDMLGNVWVWTDDAYQEDAYRRHAADNPRNNAQNGKRVLRGGSYMSDIGQVRCGTRNFSWQDDRLPTAGLRLARDVAR